ncbi:MAG: ATP-dependent DNA helicase RecG [Flavobacteriia bacterium]|nr:ATP-dependent DNA helicase RecG [Flavobacteriia bacterium]
MQTKFFDTDITFLKGVGPEKAELLKKDFSIHTYFDLLHHFPFRYIDRSKIVSIKDAIYQDDYVQIAGTIVSLTETGKQRSKKLIAVFSDGKNQIDLVWFQGVSWVKASIKNKQSYLLFGKIKKYQNQFYIPHPDLQEFNAENSFKKFKPVYSSSEKLSAKGLNSNGFEKIISQLIQQVEGKIEDPFPLDFIQQIQLLPLDEAIHEIHSPDSLENLQKAQYRLKFEELFFLQLELLSRKLINHQKNTSFCFNKIGQYFNDFFSHHMPFELTSDQKKVLREIHNDCKSSFQMNRLLQGDVGSGKTIVAFFTMLLALDNGFQAALMAPTEILVQQHFDNFKEFANVLNLNIAKLSSSTKKKERSSLLSKLESGEIQIIVGTHALIEEQVIFKNLGVVVIDEQHRFGVAQRAKLWHKNKKNPHILVMTATPIPRTLAMTVYGDLDVSIIKELPPGRKPITTVHRFESSRLSVFQFLKEEIAKNRQIYIVYPLIEESEKLDYMNLMEGYESISRAFPLPEYRISIVHGKMKAEDKDFEMQRFIKGETQIMVATTVIEVGVNVPNASVMVIESAERFGLSQLHQLRGRVGRGAEKSYCILMTGNKISKEGKLRLETMTESQDGFKIAEVDLKLRGPGDLLGTQQSGILDLKIADLTKDGEVLSRARTIAIKMLEEDPSLEKKELQKIREKLENKLNNKINWSKIS